MKIAVLGPGGVGGYFGGRLAAAGEDVTFIARGAHLAAIRDTGLRVESANGDFHVHPARVTDDPATVGSVDVLLFAVKLFDTEAAAEFARPLVGPATTVVNLQNGVESEAITADILGSDRVMGGVAYIAAVIAEPGLVRQTGAFARLVFGELDGTLSDRGRRLEEACRRAGIDATLTPQIRVEIWRKFLMLAAVSSITAATRQPIGALRGDPDLRRLFENAIGEAAAVGRASGIALPPDAEAATMTLLDGLPAPMVASMVHDLNGGRRLELDRLGGAVVRLGAAVGVATPVHAALYAVLKPYLDGRPG